MGISLFQLETLIKEAAREAVAEFAVTLNPTSDEITYRQACREFGRGWIDHQVSLHRATWKRKGVYENSPKIFSRRELQSLKDGIVNVRRIF